MNPPILHCNGQPYAHESIGQWWPKPFPESCACYTLTAIADAVWEGES